MTTLSNFRSKSSAFGVVQGLVAVSIIGLVASVAVPASRDAVVSKRGEVSAENLRMIEYAKKQFAINNPDAEPLGVSDIEKYLPDGKLPTPAHPGESYLHVYDLSRVAESSVNGIPAFEPRSEGRPLAINGYNDLRGRTAVVPASGYANNPFLNNPPQNTLLSMSAPGETDSGGQGGDTTSPEGSGGGSEGSSDSGDLPGEGDGDGGETSVQFGYNAATGGFTLELTWSWAGVASTSFNHNGTETVSGVGVLRIVFANFATAELSVVAPEGYDFDGWSWGEFLETAESLTLSDYNTMQGHLVANFAVR